MIEVAGLNKVYAGGFQALRDVDLEIQKGEIFALLGPNGAGKTTLIGCICGLLNPTSGKIAVGGFDVISEYRKARRLVGLVPQELTTDAFESVWNTVSFSRGLFGLAPHPTFIEEILKKLSLWDKKDNRLMTLSGGMKRRVMIAKALSHEPRVLFLDEPTAGVDVELRKDMWAHVRELQSMGVTIILTTHYIEEAEEMADRIAVINGGEIKVVDTKDSLIKKMGMKQMFLDLRDEIESLPASLQKYDLSISEKRLIYTYDSKSTSSHTTELFKDLREAQILFTDIETKQSSLEDIFVQLVSSR